MKLLDAEILDSLRDLQSPDDPHFLRNFLKTILDALPSRFATLQNALSSNDFQCMMSEAHALKSSFSNAGALTMAQLCQQMELAAKQKQMDQLTKYFEELSAKCQILTQEVSQLPEFKIP